MKDAIITFITDEILEEDERIDADENLLADGMVDSLGMLRLIGFIDEQFGLVIPPEDFILDNFRTVNQLMSYLARRSAE
ncbi:MAG: acyl carrier protein [Pseudomonadota bacterium]